MFARGGADRRSCFASPVVLIQSEGEVLNAHRSILEAASPCVRDELNSFGFAKSLHMYDSHKTVNMFIEFLYTGRYTLPPPPGATQAPPAIPARRTSSNYVSELSHGATVPLKDFNAFRNKNPEDLRPAIEPTRSDVPAIMAHARVCILAQQTGVLELSQHARENLAESLAQLDQAKVQENAGALGDLLGLVYEDHELRYGAQTEREKLKETVMVFASWNLEAIMKAASGKFKQRMEKGGRLMSDLMGTVTRRLVFPQPAAEDYVAPVQEPKQEEEEVPEEVPVAPAPEPVVEPEPLPAPVEKVEKIEEPIQEPVKEPIQEPVKEPIQEPTKEPVKEPEPAPEQLPEPTPEKAPEAESQPEPEAAPEPAPVPQVIQEPVNVMDYIEPEDSTEPEPVVEAAPQKTETEKQSVVVTTAVIPQPLPTPDPEENEHPLKKESESPSLSDEYPTPPTVFAREGWIEDGKMEPMTLDNKDTVPASWTQEADRLLSDDDKRSNDYVDSGFTTSPQPTIASTTPPPFSPPTGPRSMTSSNPPSINGVPIPTGPKNAKKKKKAKKGSNSPMMVANPQFGNRIGGHW